MGVQAYSLRRLSSTLLQRMGKNYLRASHRDAANSSGISLLARVNKVRHSSSTGAGATNV
jgi:hypothetical protein